MWKESFQMLKWSEMKLLLLLTLNNFIRSFKITGKYFCWLFALHVAAMYWLLKSMANSGATLKILDESTGFSFLQSVFLYQLPAVNFLLPVFAVITSILFTVFFYTLAARASLELKNFSYFLRYLPRIVGFALLWLVLGQWAWALLAGFFYIDAENSVRGFLISLWRGLLCVVHFLPAVLVYSFIFGFSLSVLYAILWALVMFINPSPLIITILYAILFPLTLLQYSFFAIFYSKIKHGYYHLFFPQ